MQGIRAGLQAIEKSIYRAETLKLDELHRNCKKSKVDAYSQLYCGALAQQAYDRIRRQAEIHFLLFAGVQPSMALLEARQGGSLMLVRVKLTARSICSCGFKPDPHELELVNLLDHLVDFNRRIQKETPPCRGCGKKEVVEAVWMESSSANGKMAGWMQLAAIEIEGEKAN